MQKRKILIAVHQLTHGGVQKSLLEALKAIDYERNEITLYVRKNRLQLLSEVDSRVKRVIINQDSHHYYRKPYMVFLMVCMTCFRLFKSEKIANNIHQKMAKYINRKQMCYEQKQYFSNGVEYDIAISYIQGYTAQFVAEYVTAKRKMMFYHGSTDETHDLHMSIMDEFDKIVTVNSGVQQVLSGLYPKYSDKMIFIENYVDAMEVLNKSNEYTVDKINKDIVLCSCGRLTPVKGYDLAVKTAKILKNRNISFVWYFVGDGPENSKLKQLISDNRLERHVKITGMQDNPYPYIAGCDIYVQPSYEEAHPLSIIEAMILCSPVVTTATVGGKTLIRDRVNGLISEIEEDALADSIEELIRNVDLRCSMVSNLEKIDHSRDFEQYQIAWKGLLGGRTNEV